MVFYFEIRSFVFLFVGWLLFGGWVGSVGEGGAVGFEVSVVF